MLDRNIITSVLPLLLLTHGCLAPDIDDSGIYDDVDDLQANVDNNIPGPANLGNVNHPNHADPDCDGPEPRNDHEVVICNDLDEGIIARYEFPDGDAPDGGWPAVLLLHGSGGLFRTLNNGNCSIHLENQFRRWADLLTDLGYAVLMPASFYSRGFCDWNDAQGDGDLPPGLDKDERTVVRTIDAAAAAKYLCDDPRVDCDRIAALGFSDGGTTLLTLFHEDHTDCPDERLHNIDDGLPDFVGGVAYYPGCNLHGQVTSSFDLDDVDRMYFPRAPIRIAHASKDPMVEKCEDMRDPQVDLVLDHRNIDEDPFDLHIYNNAKHSFDNATNKWPKADRDAKAHALAITLDLFDEWFGQ